MKKRVYIETTIVSYLTAKPSRDIILAARQTATEQWWREYGPKCDLFVSELVVREAGRGNNDASRRRTHILAGIPRLPASDEVRLLAKRLVKFHVLPSNAEDDTIHVALAAVHGMDALLTWNYRHIANVMAGPRMRDIIEEAAYAAPMITTPLHMLESMGGVP